MAHKIRTVMTYPLNGSTVDFGITFEYLARKFVSVTLIGKDRKELVFNQDFRFTTKTQITTTRAWSPSDGYTMIEIRRLTSATDRLVDFSDGSILRAYDLNIAQIQTLHVAEEARDLTADTIGVNNDGNLDARGRRIVNLATAVDDSDAISLGQVKGWNESALNSANNARASEDRAWQHRESARVSKENSENSANWAKKWAVDPNVVAVENTESLRSAKTYSEWAKGDASAAFTWKEQTLTYKNEAFASAQSANGSKEAAKVSEVNAKSSEERAILEASKLGNMNLLSAAIKQVIGSDVYWKGLHRFTNAVQLERSENTDHVYRQGMWATDNSINTDFVIQFPGADHGGVFSFMDWTYPFRGTPQVNMNAVLVPRSEIVSEAAFPRKHASQYTAKAPFFNQVPYSGGTEYFPLIKQRSYQDGADARAWSQGILVNDARVNTWNILSTDEGGNSKVWTFDPAGDTTFPGNHTASRFAVTGGYLDSQGKVWGNAYGGKYLDDFIRENWVGDVYWGSSRRADHNIGQYHDNVAGWGEGCAGVAINSNGTVASVIFRALWISFHDGKKRIVASQ